jgi:hypothetical protein
LHLVGCTLEIYLRCTDLWTSNILLILTSWYTFFYLTFSYTPWNLHAFLTSPMSHDTYIRITCFFLTYTLTSVLYVFLHHLWAYIRLTFVSLPPFYLHQCYSCVSNMTLLSFLMWVLLPFLCPLYLLSVFMIRHFDYILSKSSYSASQDIYLGTNDSPSWITI